MVALEAQQNNRKGDCRMKKWRRRISLFVCIVLSCVMFVGCTDEKEEVSGVQTEETEKHEKPEKPENPVPAPEEPEEESKEAREVTIYCVDDETGEMTTKTAMIEDEQDIWEVLQESGILTEECELKSFTVDKEKRKIDLDVNLAVGERIRSMGTTGELQIIGSIVNTYSEAYDCDGVKITEEGNPLQSGHAIYDGYNQKIDF